MFYYCRTHYKAVRVWGEENGGHVLRETTSRGLYVLYERGTGPVTKSYCGVPSLKFLLTLVCV